MIFFVYMVIIQKMTPPKVEIEYKRSAKRIKMDRCYECKKKVLLPVYCRCSLPFCMTHRHPEDHDCCVDFKEIGKEKLTLENPKIEPVKVDVI